MYHYQNSFNLKKNIIIVAARRSGTHLLSDLIVNNFGYEHTVDNYLDFTEFTYPKLNGFEKLMAKGGKVTHTHAHNFKDYHKHLHKPQQEKKIDSYFKSSKIIFIYRDSRDIIASCYQRPKIQNKYSSFTDFYQNFDFEGYELIDQKYDNLWELLQQHYRNWFSTYFARELLGLDMEVISFKEIINDYSNAVHKIGKFINQPVTDIVDVRLNSIKDKAEGVIYTSNDFNVGKVGRWQNILNKTLSDKIEKEYTLEIGNGLNCFTNDIQIHKYHSPERHKFKINYRDWDLAEKIVDKKLKKYKDKFKNFNLDINKLLEERYKKCDHQATDLRYIHKVFYYKDYVLKFIYPCKSILDIDNFKKTIPIASKELLLTILQTDTFLYKNNIIPKLHYAGIYRGILFVVQERCPSLGVLNTKFNFYPEWDDWTWPVKFNIYEKIVRHFNKALENNILLTDIVSVYNCAIDENGDLKYFDLDGIKYFESKEEMVNSEDYKNIMGIFSEVDKYNIFININK